MKNLGSLLKKIFLLFIFSLSFLNRANTNTIGNGFEYGVFSNVITTAKNTAIKNAKSYPFSKENKSFFGPIGGTINSYAAVNTISGTDFTVDNATAFSSGDLVMIIQMQGATINTTNTSSYGDIISYNDVGNFELVTIASIAGNTISFGAITKTYDANGTVQIIKVPDYSISTNTTVNTTISGLAFDGAKGGVIVIYADELTLNADIDASGLGFRGGSINTTDYTTAGFVGLTGAQKGEGIAKFSAVGDRKKGKQANGGGAGNYHNTAGAGGGNLGLGGRGGEYRGDDTLDRSGSGGAGNDICSNTYGKETTASRPLYMGGGGGAGDSNNGGIAIGGTGGGIIFIFASTLISGPGEIIANGTNGSQSTKGDGSSGGAAGGSLYLDIPSVTGTIDIELNGGNGGNSTSDHSAGGGGGGGAFYFNGPIPANYNITANGGNHGTGSSNSTPEDGFEGGFASFIDPPTITDNQSFSITLGNNNSGDDLTGVSDPGNSIVDAATNPSSTLNNWKIVGPAELVTAFNIDASTGKITLNDVSFLSLPEIITLNVQVENTTGEISCEKTITVAIQCDFGIIDESQYATSNTGGYRNNSNNNSIGVPNGNGTSVYRTHANNQTTLGFINTFTGGEKIIITAKYNNSNHDGIYLEFSEDGSTWSSQTALINGFSQSNYTDFEFTIPTSFTGNYKYIRTQGEGSDTYLNIDAVRVGTPYCSTCPAGVVAPNLSTVSAFNTCATHTIDLTTLTANNTPANTTLTWHTATPATDANLVPDPLAVLTGYYYAAFYSSAETCYSGLDGNATTRVLADGDNDCDGVPNNVDIDDDNDGILDRDEQNCEALKTTEIGILNWHGTAAADITNPTLSTIYLTGANWANAYSDETFSLPIRMEGTLTYATSGMIGFLPISNAETTNAWQDNGYKFQFNPSNGMNVRNGTNSAGWHNPSPIGKTFIIAITKNGHVTYSHDGTIIYEAVVPIENYKVTISRGNFVITDLSITSLDEECINIDTDNDTIPNHLDLDSDDDGCSDSVEAGNTLVGNNNISSFNTGTDANSNGLLDQFENGTTGTINYTETNHLTIDDTLDVCADTDGDGIGDILDLDSDNDGILDEDEQDCTATTTINPTDLTWHGPGSLNISSPSANTIVATGTTWSTAYSDETFSLPFKIEGTISSATNGMIGFLPVSGTELTTNHWNDGGYKLQFNNSSGIYIRHGTKTAGWYAPSLVGQKFTLAIDINGQMSYSRDDVIIYSNVVPVEDYRISITRGPFTITDFTVQIQKEYCANIDTDGDLTPDHLDLDSDGDGCSDSVETGNTPPSNNNISTYNTGTDANANGLLDVFENGTMGTINYSPANHLTTDNLISACDDFDNDGVGDALDLDSDNDGILDIDEQNCEVITTIQAEDLDWHGNAAPNVIASSGTTLTVSGSRWGTAYSDQTFSLPIKIEGTLTAAGHGMIGVLPLSESEATSNTWSDGGYKFELNASNGMYIRHGSTNGGWKTPSLLGKKFTLDISKTGLMTYSNDGTIVYSGTIPVEKYKIAISRGAFTVSDFIISTFHTICDPIDTDGDLTPDHLDLDSDDDGCSDSVEAGNTSIANNNISTINSGTDANNNGLLDIFEDGTTGNINYTHTNHLTIDDQQSACTDTDGDGISDLMDLDSDNDGILDKDEQECNAFSLSPTNLTWHGPAASNISHPTSTSITVTGSAWSTAYSDQTFSLPVIMEGTMTSATRGMIGFIPVSNTEVTTNTWNDGGYKFQFNNSNGMYVRHNTNNSGWVGPSLIGNKFRLEIDETGRMTYSNNGTIIYSGPVPIEDYKITITRGAFSISDFSIFNNSDTCTNIDTDGDTTPNHLDIDSDGDGCSDSVEAGNTLAINNNIITMNTGIDANNNGLLDVFEDGTTGTINYTATNHLSISDQLDACTDTDGDGIGDLIDLDDDNDGILDAIEMEACENDNLIAPTAIDSYSSTFNGANAPNSFNGAGLTGDGITAIHSTSNSNQFRLPHQVTTGWIKYDIPSGSNINGVAIWVTDLTSAGEDGPLKDFTIEVTYNGGTDTFISQEFSTIIANLGKAQLFYFQNALNDVTSIKVNILSGWIGSGTSFTSSDNRATPSSYNLGLAEIRVLCTPTAIDTDGDTIPNHLDLDSDGDGIPDNIEAQQTITYLAPSGTIDSNGVYTNYTGGLTPIDTDGDEIPDYIDTDADSAQGNDNAEAALTLSNVDADTDGLDDAIDTDDANFAPVNAGITDVLTAYPNNGEDVDWRTQCPNGIIELDPSFVVSTAGSNTFGAASNLNGEPNGSIARLWTTITYDKTIDFGEIKSANTKITFYQRSYSGYDNTYTISYSTNNIDFTLDPAIGTASSTSVIPETIIASKKFRYIRLTGNKSNSYVGFDAVSVNNETCVMYTAEVFHDSGLGGGTYNDNIKNGTEGPLGLPTEMFINVINSSNAIVHTAPIETDGTYKIPELVDGNYTLIITDDNTSIVASLPEFWFHSLSGSGNYTISVASGLVTTPSTIPLLGIYLCGQEIIISSAYAISSSGSTTWGGTADGAANSPDGVYQNVYNTGTGHQTIVEFADTFTGGQSIEVWAKQYTSSYTAGFTISFSENGSTYTANSAEINGLTHTLFKKVKYNIPTSLTGNYKYARIQGVGGTTLLLIDAVKVNLPLEFSTPKVRTILTVKDGLGTSLENTNIALGTDFFYHIDFQNVGFDNIQDLNIVFDLADNVEVNLADITAPSEVTPSYDAANHRLQFVVANSIVEFGDPSYNIKIKATLAAGCEKYREVCANEIKAQTLSSYKGLNNTAQINDIPSVKGLDTCDIPIEGTTDFNIDLLSDCEFKREEILCGGSLLLEAGTGFDTYVWKNSLGATVGSTSSYTAIIPGVYTVSVTSTCLNYTEEITVVNFGGNITNPVLNYADDTALCPNDGTVLPKLLLCGINDTRLIETNILSADSVEWQKLDETSCTSPLEDKCANRDNSCWTTFFTGTNYTVADAGKYRLKVNYQNGCFNFHYFNIYKNDLDPSVTVKNMICGNPGSITIGNVPTGATGYEFSLNGTDYATTNPIAITTENNYTVYLRRIGHTPGECIFTEDVLVEKLDISVDVFPTHIKCKGEKGSIRIHANGVEPQYFFKLIQGANTVGDSGPKPDKDFTFDNLNGGLYTIEITTDDGCTKTIVDYEIEDSGDLNATIDTAPITCVDGRVIASATGGTAPYQYAIYSYNGTVDFDVNNPDPAKLQTSTDFDITLAGTYQIAVMDANGCIEISAEKDVIQDTPPEFTVAVTDITCFVANVHTGIITVNVSDAHGGLISYSIDGTSFQNTNIFTNLPAGPYTVIVRKELGGTICDYTDNVTITSPDTALSAYAGILENVICSGVAETAKVAITNANGGIGPYEYSFDGGVNYSTTSNTDLPVGNHNLFIKDSAGCTFAMTVTIFAPPIAPSIIIDTTYNCDGTGEATFTISDSNLNYFYELDGSPNTPADSNVFSDIAVGNHTITLNYLSKEIITSNILFVEDFGVNQDASLATISPAFCFETQNSSNSCGTNNEIIDSGEYSITHTIVNPETDWVTATDHGNQPSWGKFLAVNIGNTTTGEIMYRNTITNIISNRNISLSINALNLLKSTASGLDPDLTIQLVNSSNVVVAQTTSGAIAKNEMWNVITLDADPGANISLDLVIRTNSSGAIGNVIALDSFEVFQAPEECYAQKDLIFDIEGGKELQASTTALSDLSCNGTSDGSITFKVSNFDAIDGFEYNLNGGPYTTSTNSIVNITGINTTSITVIVRDINDTSCAITLNETINEPTVLTASSTITSPNSCNNGATITATAAGGTPTYSYQLEDDLGGIITSFQANNFFSDIIAGDYTIRVMDSNSCETTTTITINPINDITFTTLSTPCYSGANNGSIQVDITAGNGDYTFSISGPTGPWVVPTPATAITHTFPNLSAGTYTIDVHDKLGCTGTQQVITINSLLAATVITTDVSCNDGEIAVTATGGDNNYVYAYKKRAIPATPETVTPADFGTSDSHAVITADAGTYDVFVRDHSGGTGFCEFTKTVVINAAPALTINSIANAPKCFGENGAIQLDITAGDGPFDIALTDVDHAGANNATITSTTTITHAFNNLPAGDYTIAVTDVYGCIKNSATITIIDPDLLEATLAPKHPAVCGDPDPLENGFMFTAYPDYTAAGLTMQFSNDGGITWVTPGALGTTYTFVGFLPGATVNPAMRTINGGGIQQCIKIFDPYEIPFPLRDLFPIANPEGDCNDGMNVRVDQYGGTGPFEFSYDLVNWFPAVATTPPSRTFSNLIPGRDYTFYLKDLADNCIVQNSSDVYANLPPLDMQIAFFEKPTCAGGNTGEITFEITDADGTHEDLIRWGLYDEATDLIVQNSAVNLNYAPGAVLFTVNNLAAGKYYLKAIQVDGTSTDTCIGGSKDIVISQGAAITGTPALVSGITCDTSGFINVPDITGGWGSFTYTISSTNFTADIVSTDSNVALPYANLVNTSLTTFIASVTVVDQYGCTPLPINLGDVTVTVAQPGAIDSVVTNNCTAPYSIVVTPTPGPDYVYSIDNGITYFDNAGVFNDVTTGTHNVIIKDKITGCTVTHSVSTIIYPAFEATAIPTTLLGCASDAQVTISVSNGAGDYAYEVSGDATVARTNFVGDETTINIIADGNYTITVYDNNRATCPDIVIPVKIETAIMPTIAIDTFEDVDCFGNNNGSISVSTTDEGYGPYVFTIIATDGTLLGAAIVPTTTTNNTAVFTGLAPTTAGGHTIQVSATNACTLTIDQAISEPAAIVLPALILTSYSCAAGNTADQITVSIDETAIIGGSAPFVSYEFVYDNGTIPNTIQKGASTSFIVPDRIGGTVTLTVTDANGCMATSPVIPIPNYDELLSITINTTDAISCTNAGEDISIAVSSTNNNTSKFEYSVNNGTSWSTTNTFDDLAIGAHAFLVRHTDTGCTLSIAHDVADPNTTTVVVSKISDVACVGENGAITIDVQDPNYTSGYSYEIFDAVSGLTTGIMGTGTTNIISAAISVPAGNYSVSVIQSALPECTNTHNFQIINPPSGVLVFDSLAEINPVTCTNDQGAILAQAIGGWGITQYQFVNKDTGATLQDYSVINTLGNLAAGNYTVNLKDEQGCVESQDITLSPTIPISATANQTDFLLCNGDKTATLEVTASGGEGNFVYALIRNGVLSSSQQLSNTFTNLDAGTYAVVVTDGWACNITTTPDITIVDPTPIIPIPSITTVLGCATLAEVTVTASGGTGPYTYSDNGITFQTSPVFNKGVGNYNFYAKDSNGCVSDSSSQIAINAVVPLAIILNTDLAKVNCTDQNTAILSADVTGGLGDYEYELLDGSNNIIGTRQVDKTFINLAAGTYKIKVYSKDCDDTSLAFTIDNPAPLVYNDPVVANVTCAGANDGRIVFDVTGGTGTIKYAISPNLSQFDTKNEFTDLAPGNYQIIIVDENGCLPIYVDIAITEPLPLDATIINIEQELCAGDADASFDVEINGGTAPYATSLNSSNDDDFILNRTVFTGLEGGETYDVYIKDANGCVTSTSITLDAPVDLTAEVGVIYECQEDNVSLANTVTITIAAQFANDVIYTLDGDSTTEQLENTFHNLSPGAHTISIIHSNGCINDQVTFTIQDNPEPLVLQLSDSEINTIIANANDGGGDYLYSFNGEPFSSESIYLIEATDTYSVTVKDAYGCTATEEIFVEFIDVEFPMYFSPNGDGKNDLWKPKNLETYPNVIIKIFDRYGRNIKTFGKDGSWDGVFKNANLPSGDYWYTIGLNREDDSREFIGHFSLVR